MLRLAPYHQSVDEARSWLVNQRGGVDRPASAYRFAVLEDGLLDRLR